MKKILIILTLFILTSNCSKLNFFGFGEEKNKYEKLKINEYLWKASNNLLNKYSSTETDLKEGSISTDWIRIKKAPKVRFRISIYILGSNLAKDNIIKNLDKLNWSGGFYRKDIGYKVLK